MSHWVYKGTPYLEAPEDMAGFVYLITNILTGKQYIGKKIFWSKVTKPPLKGKKNKRHSVKGSGWETYTSSSKYVNDDIKELGKEHFTFEILTIHPSRGELNYAELRSQIFNEVLEARMEDGTRAFYNENICQRHYNSDKYLEERNVNKQDLILLQDTQ